LIALHWPDWFRSRYGSRWPRDYLAFDVETTGLSLTEDLVVEWGHCLVRDAQVVDQATMLIDWTSCVHLDQDWLVARLAAVQAQLQAAGRTYSVSWERLRREGVAPAEALAQIDELARSLLQSGGCLVAHNGYGFDEQASQVPGDARVLPQPGDSLRQYFSRVRALSLPGVRSNLDTHCYQKYLAELGVDRSRLHQAQQDAYCCHLLMEVWRKEADLPYRPPLAGQLPANPATTALIRYRGQRNN